MKKGRSLGNRVLIILLIVLLLSSNAIAYADSSTDEYINTLTSLYDAFQQDDVLCKTEEDEVANGCYYIARLLAILAQEMDSSDTDSIDEVLESIEAEKATTTDAMEAASKYIYNSVELLSMVAKNLDTRGSYKSYIETILSDLKRNDAKYSNGELKLANSSYRLFDMMTVIAVERGVETSLISAVDDALPNSSYAPAATAGALYCNVDLCYYIVKSGDVAGLFSSSIDSVLMNRDKLNNVCSSTVQQQINGTQRLFEMLTFMAMEFYYLK